MLFHRTRRTALRSLLEVLEPRVLLSALPTVNLTLARPTATELNGFSTGAGKFTLTRSGSTAAPLTVAFTLDSASTALNGMDFNPSTLLTGTATFATGSASTFILINPVDTNLADGPKKLTLDLITTGTTPAYSLGTHRQATLTILDHAPTITLTATKSNASEINGLTTGAGIFTFKRSGPTTSPLTVDFSLSGNALEGTDYTSLPSHSINFTLGQSTSVLTINPMDDLLTEGPEKVTLALAPDATPASYHFKTTPASITIADDTRPLLLGTLSPLAGAVKNTPFTISYNHLLAAINAFDRAGKPISFKITALKSGTLQCNNVPAIPGKSLISAADALTWTPASGATGTLAAFSVIATDGTHSTPVVTLSVIVTDPAAVIPHPASIQVLPAALDQPQINAIAYLGNSTTPQVGTTTTLDPNTLDSITVNTFNVTGYLDTGASSILISSPTNSVLNLPLLDSNGTPVIYSDVGVAGSDNFQVSDTLHLSLANSYPRTDLDQFSDPNQTIPITTPYTPVPNSLHVQVGPYVPTVDNPITDEFSSLINDLGALDVIGMPAMMGRVTVIDPTRVNNFGTVLDALVADPSTVDLNLLNSDLSVHSFIYAPGTPFHPATTDTDPGIPATDLHVKLSYASFDRFTTVTPPGNPGPTLDHNPFIGQDPVGLLEGTPQASVPGIKISRTIPAAGGGTATLSSEGNWLLDTGAAASIISKAQAAKLDVTYAPGTFGTDAPVLVDQNGNPLPDQFTLGIGGIGGQETLAGFYLDSLLLRTQEGSPTNDANPNNILYSHEPVLVGDVTVKDPNTNQTLTLDGIFGMNNLIASADFSLDATGNISNLNATPGYYNWITFDEPNGILGLSFDPAALTPPAAAARTPATLRSASLFPTLLPQLSPLSAGPSLTTAPTTILTPLLTPSTQPLSDPLLITLTPTLTPSSTPLTPAPTLTTLTIPAPLTSPTLTPTLLDPHLSHPLTPTL